MTKTKEAASRWCHGRVYLSAAAAMGIVGLGAVQLNWPCNKGHDNGAANRILSPRSLREEAREEENNTARTRRVTTNDQNPSIKITKQKFLLLLGPRSQRFHHLEQDLLRWSEASFLPNWIWPMLELPQNATASERDAVNIKELLQEFLTNKPNVDADTEMQAKYRYAFSKAWNDGMNIVFGRDSLASLMTDNDVTGSRLRQRFLETMPWVPSTNPPSSLAGSEEDNLELLLVHHGNLRITGFLEAFLSAKRGQTMAQFLLNLLNAASDNGGSRLRAILDPLNLVHQLVVQNGLKVVLVNSGGVEQSGKNMSHVVACEVMGEPCRNGHVLGMDAHIDLAAASLVEAVDNNKQIFTENIDPNLLSPEDENYLHKLNDILIQFDETYCHLTQHPSLQVLYQHSLFSTCTKKSTTDTDTQSRLISQAYNYLHTQIQHLATSWKKVSDNQFAPNHQYHPYNTFNPHPSWCPTAACVNSPQCSPCQRRFLLEISTGRSGSTSLLRMLNLLPGVRLSGENNNQLHALYQMTNNIESNVMLRYGPSDGAWGHEKIGKMDFACPVQSMVAAMDPPKYTDEFTLENKHLNADAETILGFKTIRFLTDWPSDEVAVNFLKEKLPCSRIVININSNVTKQSGSSWWSRNRDESKEKLQDYNDRLLKVAQKLGQRQAYVLDSDQWTHNVTVLNKMVEWLGFKDCVFNDVLHDHDAKKSVQYIDNKTKIELGPDCRYAG